MNAFINHFSFEFRTGIRNKTLLLMNYLFPLGFYAMMGLLMTGINPAFRETMIPTMTVFAVLAATILGLPDPLVTAREAGIFRSYKINGVPAFSILVIPALTTILHTAVVTIIITSTAPLFFDAPLPVNWLGFIVTFLPSDGLCLCRAQCADRRGFVQFAYDGAVVAVNFCALDDFEWNDAAL